MHGHWTIDVRNPDGTLVTHREFENALHGADDAALVVLRDEQRTLAARHAIGDLAPERDGLGPRHRLHEADRRAAFDAIDQHVGQRVDVLGGLGRVEPSHGHGVGHPFLRFGLSGVVVRATR